MSPLAKAIGVVALSYVDFDNATNGALSFSENCSETILENVRMGASNLIDFDPSSAGRYWNISPEPNPPIFWRTGVLVRFLETSDPSAPPSDTGALYVRDNGSAKSQLCVRFSTGAVQIIASEP